MYEWGFDMARKSANERGSAHIGQLSSFCNKDLNSEVIAPKSQLGQAVKSLAVKCLPEAMQNGTHDLHLK